MPLTFQGRKSKIWILALMSPIAIWLFWPMELFDSPTSTVLYAESGELLGARIASDQQWRFPSKKIESKKLVKSTIYFEDQYFYWHPGFNPVSLFKAMKTNLAQGQVVRGGSTITQQCIRLSRKNKSRTYLEKCIELVLALKLELHFSKKEILNFYLNHAPYGGNIVGVEAASWRYFSRPTEDLSWAEAACLAVLPNAPGIVRPDLNTEILRNKRNFILKKLMSKGILDSLSYENALLEPLPKSPHPLPNVAYHLLEKTHFHHPGEKIESTIDAHLQVYCNEIINRHYLNLKHNEVHNLALLVVDNHSKAIKAYIGNAATDSVHHFAVDMIPAPRSTGSILKPFLFAAALEKGEITPQMLLGDVPTQYGDYSPKNFNESYQGAVSCEEAIFRSLNIPSIRLLSQFGTHRFLDDLQSLRLDDIRFSADHYGLSLILGGAESSLYDLTRAYSALSTQLQTKKQISVQDLNYTSKVRSKGKILRPIPFSPISIWHTAEAMHQVKRPETEGLWKYFDGGQKIAWKTGTSFGNKDAWAIGFTKKYTVGIWVGNADGEGRSGISGSTAAAPILFEIFKILPRENEWFEKPIQNTTSVEICVQSGYAAQEHCPESTYEILNNHGIQFSQCPYHKRIYTTLDGNFRVHKNCESIENIKSESYFILPPVQAYYYKIHNPFYKELPPWREDCKHRGQQDIEFVYPYKNAILSVPKNLSGETEKILSKVIHKHPDRLLYWYLNSDFVGTTKDIHEMEIAPHIGEHQLLVVDDFGQEQSVTFYIK